MTGTKKVNKHTIHLGPMKEFIKYENAIFRPITVKFLIYKEIENNMQR